MGTVAAVIVLFALGAAVAVRLERWLQIFQQEHYEGARLQVWVTLHRREQFDALMLATIVAGTGTTLTFAATDRDVVALVAALVGAAVIAVAANAVARRESIKPLVWTPRARRLGIVSALLSAAALTACIVAASGAVILAAATAVAVVLLAAAAAVVRTANWLLRPYQRWDAQRFVNAARQKLRAGDPLVIGVSGSFGKTTTKGCLAALLTPTGPTYPTPASFNSYLGIVRAINEGLLPRHVNFIAELGAYRIGDIAELCELVRPTVGVLASLGPAHLERFGSMEAIAQAEGEVAEALPADGLFVTRADDPRCVAVARDRARCACVLVSPAPHPEADLWADDVEVGPDGTRFWIHVRGGAEPVQVTSPLLGEANVANVLLAVAVAQHLGVTNGQLARAMKRIEIPPHRLQPIVNQAAGVVVIDDSYNSNPTGAASALQILGAFPASRRVLITPGMVELGEQEESENIALGRKAAAVCDLCLLIGHRGELVARGLREAGVADENILTFATGPQAQAALQQLTRRGDVILFENDLPDVYV
jgi:UDP-N-acetylmuramoyl-tripeptide--D-alanyl-D-alanine ligase